MDTEIGRSVHITDYKKEGSPLGQAQAFAIATTRNKDVYFLKDQPPQDWQYSIAQGLGIG